MLTKMRKINSQFSYREYRISKIYIHTIRKNRKHIIRVVFSLLHKDRKTKMLHKASKQAIYNSIYEEEIYNLFLLKTTITLIL